MNLIASFQIIVLIFVSAVSVQVTAANQDKSGKKTPVTVTTPIIRNIEIKLESVGTMQSLTEPVISAEIEARVVSIHVDVGDRVKKGDVLVRLDDTATRMNRNALVAEVKNLQAEIKHARKNVTRYRTLKQRNLISSSQLDDEETKLTVFRMRLERAQALLAIAEDSLHRSTVRSPVDGVIDQRKVSVGDFVKIEGSLFKLSTSNTLRAIAAFPETAVEQLRIGQKMYIRYPLAKLYQIEAPITEIRPMINIGNKSVQVLVDFTNPGIFKPGASFIAEVVLEQHDNAIIVPVLSVVKRPAGDVVYIIKDALAHQQIVKIGKRFGNEIEIIEGLNKDAVLAFDGAGFLTDGAPVDIKDE